MKGVAFIVELAVSYGGHLKKTKSFQEKKLSRAHCKRKNIRSSGFYSIEMAISPSYSDFELERSNIYFLNYLAIKRAFYMFTYLFLKMCFRKEVALVLCLIHSKNRQRRRPNRAAAAAAATV